MLQRLSLQRGNPADPRGLSFVHDPAKRHFATVVDWRGVLDGSASLSMIAGNQEVNRHIQTNGHQAR